MPLRKQQRLLMLGFLPYFNSLEGAALAAGEGGWGWSEGLHKTE